MWQLIIPLMLTAGSYSGTYNVTYRLSMSANAEPQLAEDVTLDIESYRLLEEDTGCRATIAVYIKGNRWHAYNARPFKTEVPDVAAGETERMEIRFHTKCVSKYRQLTVPESGVAYSIDTTLPGMSVKRIEYLIQNFSRVVLVYNDSMLVQHIFAFSDSNTSIDKTVSFVETGNYARKDRPILHDDSVLKKIIEGIYHLDCCFEGESSNKNCVPFRVNASWCVSRANAMADFIENGRYNCRLGFIHIARKDGNTFQHYDQLLQQNISWRSHTALVIPFQAKSTDSVSYYVTDPSVLHHSSTSDLVAALGSYNTCFAKQEWINSTLDDKLCPSTTIRDIDIDMYWHPEYGGWRRTPEQTQDSLSAPMGMVRNYCHCHEYFEPR